MPHARSGAARLLLIIAAPLCLAAGPAGAVTEDARVNPLYNDNGTIDFSADNSFGYSVDVDGDRMVGGAPFEAGSDVGAVYEFGLNGEDWEQLQKILPGDAPKSTRFGYSVSLDGSKVLIGAPRDDDKGTDAGAAYLFQRQGNGSWAQLQKFTASDGAAQDQYGHAVALAGSVIAIGAPLANGMGGSNSGAVYVYRQGIGGWLTDGKLEPSDAVANQYFGSSVDIDGIEVLAGVGFSGSGGFNPGAYLFRRTGGIPFWTQQQKLTPGDPAGRFGDAVTLDGDLAVVGAPGDDDAASNAGAAYVYERNGGPFAQIAKLQSQGLFSTDAEFGDSVDLLGERVVIGEPGKIQGLTAGGLGVAGAAYLFERSAGSWPGEVTLLQSTLTAAGDEKGFAVALSEDWVAVGAPEADPPDSPTDAGFALLYFVGMIPVDPETEIVPLLSGAGIALLAILLAVAGARRRYGPLMR